MTTLECTGGGPLDGKRIPHHFIEGNGMYYQRYGARSRLIAVYELDSTSTKLRYVETARVVGRVA